MEYVIIIAINILILITLKIIFEINIKELKETVKEGNLDKIVSKFPSNDLVCKEILQMQNNTKTKIKIAEGNTTLYTIFNDTILISNKEDNYTRIQTIAHEVLHSKQNKKMLWFNFVFSNIYYLVFFLIIILTIFKVIQPCLTSIYMLTILGMVYYFVRSYLETDAMTRAKDTARAYIDKIKTLNSKEKELVLNKYDEINKIGIKMVNYALFRNCIIKNIICCIIFLML